jgi:imidazolonepropionase
MIADLMVHSASQLLTLAGGPQRGDTLGELGIIQDGAVVCHEGRILAVGNSSSLRQEFQPSTEINANQCVVMPGFVDPHTHLVWMGDRASEFEKRIQGKSYTEIMAAGGGILSTVSMTREASIEQLLSQARKRLSRMLRHGTTTAETKSGYGLEVDTEIKILDVIQRLGEEGPIELFPTFLGAHAVPHEYTNAPQEYADLVSQEMLPSLHKWWKDQHGDQTLPFVDVFCETGAFNLTQSEKILASAKELGFPLKIHADEFESLGGTGMAVRLGAVSADHLVSTPPEEIEALGRSETVAVSLPATPFGLSEADFTPAGDFLTAGGYLAIATDLNPGTAWCESMQFVIALACRHLGLTQAQAIAASTVNAAKAIAQDESVGSLEIGKQADIIVLDIEDYRQLGYRFGTNLVSTVIKKGHVVSGKGEYGI